MKKKEKLLALFAGAAMIAGLWQILSMTGAGSFIPPPVTVFARTIEIFPSVLSFHTAASFGRILVSVAAASIFAYPLALLAALSGKGEKIISPAAYLLYPVPKIALLPLFLIFFGIGEISKIMVVFAVIFFQMLISVRDSIKGIEKEYFTSISLLGGKPCHTFIYVIWPHTLPRVISSLRISTATALSVLFFAETFGTRKGLGFFIMDSWIRVAYADMLAGIVCISLLGILLFSVLDAAENYFCSWKNSRG